MTNRHLWFLIIIELSGFEKSMDLERRVDNPDDAYQHHETRRKEVDDEFQGILQIKAPDECLDAEREKKKRCHCDQDIFPPPEARAHRTFLLGDFGPRYPCQGTLSRVFGAPSDFRIPSFNA